MAKIVWDKTGDRVYETGVDQGVLYLKDGSGAYPLGVAWNGLINVSENPTGAEANPQYADNMKYLNLVSAEEFEATLEAFTYPDDFAKCDGSARPTGIPGVLITGQPRSLFGLVYRTLIGNDTDGTAYGYKLHLVYEALAAPTDKSYGTINDSPEAMTFSWDLTTTPVPITGFKPSACLIIESYNADEDCLVALEEILYGKDAVEEDTQNSIPAEDAVLPRIPLPDELLTIMTPAAG